MLQIVRSHSALEYGSLAEVHDLSAIRKKRHQELVAAARDELILGDEELALELCMQAISVYRSYDALSLAGSLCAILGELEQSAGFTKEAIELAPKRPDAYYDLASTFLDMGMVNEAVKLLEKGLKLLGSRCDDLYDFMSSAYIEALAEQGEIREAEAALTKARGRTEDMMGLLDGASEVLEKIRRRPKLVVVKA